MSKQREGKQHQWKPGPRGGKRSTVSGCPWPVCARCGLVALKNQASDKAASEPCPGKDESQ